MSTEKLTIATGNDWELLRKRKATTVVDPMLARVADLFARGESGADDKAWGTISSNVEGLATFVDALVLEPGIPIFDYRYTGEGWGADSPLFEYADPVVVPVGVEAAIWGELAGDAAGAMGNKHPLPEGAALEIAANLRRLGWKFIPRGFGGSDRSDSPTAGDASNDALVNSYLYVTLLFARYASQLSDTHQPGTQILSPSQSQIFVATAAAEAVGAPAPPDEGAVFGPIEDVINQSRPGYERTWRSDRLHFMPYLLAMEDKSGKKKVQVPADLFEQAVALRNRGDVSDYRLRLSSVRETLTQEGSDDNDWIKDLQRARDAVQSALRVKPSVRTLEIKIAVTPEVTISQEVDVSPLRDWLISIWPGKRYRRLLCRLVGAQAAAKQIERGVETIWRSA